MSEVIVIKIGGSTLGKGDTTIDDIAELQKRGEALLVVHGGGALVSEWSSRLGIETKFERGRRVTDAESLDVVIAVLAGLVNKRIVAALSAVGVIAVGLSGADGGILQAEVRDKSLGFVGEVATLDAAPLIRVMMAGGVPVIAPLGLQWKGDRPTGQILNINADTAAGAIATALPAGRLILVSDVPGVQKDGQVLDRLDEETARELIDKGVVTEGMIPKVEACVEVARIGGRAIIVDGAKQHVLLDAVYGEHTGTAFGPPAGAPI